MKRELSAVVQRDYEFEGLLVTVTDVDLTPDFRQGYVYVSIIGDSKRHEGVVAKLNRDHGMLQSKVMKRVVLKFTPQLTFRLDDSVERGVRVLSAIEEVDRITPPAEEGDQSQ